MPPITIPSVVVWTLRGQYAPGLQLGGLADDTGPLQFQAQSPLPNTDLKWLQVEVPLPVGGPLQLLPLPVNAVVTSLGLYNRDTAVPAFLRLASGAGAQKLNTGAATYAFGDGQTLTILVTPYAQQTVTFHTAQFANIAAALPDEVVAAINQQLQGAYASVANASTGQLALTSFLAGTGVSLQVQGGSAQVASGFNTGSVSGTGGPSGDLILPPNGGSFLCTPGSPLTSTLPLYPQGFQVAGSDPTSRGIGTNSAQGSLLMTASYYTIV